MGASRSIGTAITALCAAVAVMCCASAPALAAEEAHPYISSLSQIGKAAAGATCGVATDSHGDIYLPNFFEEKVKVYSATNTLLTEFKTPAKVNGPCGVAVDSSGDVYVELFGKEIVKYKPKEGVFPPIASTKYEIEKSFANEGVLTFSEQADLTPRSIALDPANQDLYVAAHEHIYSYTSAGVPISETIGAGLVSGAEYVGVGVYGANGDVYVIAFNRGTSTNTAYVLNPTGTAVLTEITGVGSPAGHLGFGTEETLAVDQSDGDVYVGDIERHGVVDEFDASGAYIAQIGPEFGPSLLLEQGNPTAMTVDSGASSPNEGDVYVTGNHSGKSNLYAFGPLTAVTEETLDAKTTGTGEGAVECKVPMGSYTTCLAKYAAGTELTVRVMVEAGSELSSFSGTGSAQSCAASPCTFTLAEASTVTATVNLIALAKYPLTVAVTPSGSGTFECRVKGAKGPCASEYEENVEVEVIETPGSGYRFEAWTGACSGAGACVVKMAGAESVTAKNRVALPAFPLTVFVTGQGTVESTPAGIVCASPAEECTGELEGEVTLTETPKPGSGYEFAGWIGCRKATATTCKVDVTAAAEVTAVFLKAGADGKEGPQGVKGETGATGANGKEGAAGQKGEPGPKGSAGPEGAKGVAGETGAAGAPGEKGATGPQGERGAPGAQGPAGPAGQVELVTCRKVGRRSKCTTKLVSGTVKFTAAGAAAAARATLSRHGAVYAAGIARYVRGRMSLRLESLRRLKPGRYTLTLITGAGRHERIGSVPFTLSATRGLS